MKIRQLLESATAGGTSTASVATVTKGSKTMLKRQKPTDNALDKGKLFQEQGEKTMSRAAKGNKKYGKDGMKALAKAGREGASEKKLDAIRDRHDNYNEDSDPCWDSHKMVGTKKKGSKSVPNCVPKEGVAEGGASMPGDQYLSIPADQTKLSIGQQMAQDGITYSPDKEDELIGLMAQYMKKAGMSSKQIRYYLSYDEDFIPDQLSDLPKQGAAESFPKDPNAPKLVRDRKTGKQYDPNKEFEKKMNSPEVMAQMKRMAQKEGAAEDSVKENKKGVRAVKHTVKPRNFVAKNAAATTSGAGAHKDKKKAMKQGETKHKGKEPAYESKLWAALDRRIIK